MSSRPVGIAGLGPLFGVRAIAEAAGLDGRQVMALMESGAGHSLAPRIAARQIDRVLCENSAEVGPAGNRRIEASEALGPEVLAQIGRPRVLHCCTP